MTTASITSLPAMGGTSNQYMYINTGTGTNSGNVYYSSNNAAITVQSDSVVQPPAPPLRIAMSPRLDVTKYMYDPKAPPAVIEHGVVEISAHRVAQQLQWYKVEPNTVLELPDGTIIDVEDKYRFKIYEDNAKVTRDACRIQAFNRFLNASEMLEAFIKDCAPAGIKQNQILKVPVEAFINWLIYKAAESDGDQLPASRYNHRCGYCQRFIARHLVARGVNFCGPDHLGGYLQRTDVKLLEAPT